MRAILTVSYIGTAFAGWQYQPGQRTVQGELEKAFRLLVGRFVRVTGSGRTDTGVHALAQVCHADIDSFDIKKLTGGLNFYLPADVRVLKAAPAKDDFNARFSALSKTYRYLIANAPVQNALFGGRAYLVREPLDLKAMRAAAACFIGRRDFAAFMSSGSETVNTVRSISRLTIVKRGLIAVTVTADGFLYNMVRKIVGALLEAGRGATTNAEIERILLQKDGGRFAPAPACGLYLLEVSY